MSALAMVQFMSLVMAATIGLTQSTLPPPPDTSVLTPPLSDLQTPIVVLMVSPSAAILPFPPLGTTWVEAAEGETAITAPIT